MKKLNLKLNGSKEMLTKEQMKNITGGYDGSCYCSTLYNNEDCRSINGCADQNKPVCIPFEYYGVSGMCATNY